jgi:hypothetical protein
LLRLEDGSPRPRTGRRTVDGQLIPRDPTHAEGWDYSMKGLGVEIFGSACTDLKNGAALSVGVHYGCPK